MFCSTNNLKPELAAFLVFILVTSVYSRVLYCIVLEGGQSTCADIRDINVNRTYMARVSTCMSQNVWLCVNVCLYLCVCPVDALSR